MVAGNAERGIEERERDIWGRQVQDTEGIAERGAWDAGVAAVKKVLAMMLKCALECTN